MFTTFLAFLTMAIFCGSIIIPEIKADERKRQEETKKYNKLDVFLDDFNKKRKEEEKKK